MLHLECEVLFLLESKLNISIDILKSFFLFQYWERHINLFYESNSLLPPMEYKIKTSMSFIMFLFVEIKHNTYYLSTYSLWGIKHLSLWLYEIFCTIFKKIVRRVMNKISTLARRWAFIWKYNSSRHILIFWKKKWKSLELISSLFFEFWIWKKRRAWMRPGIVMKQNNWRQNVFSFALHLSL